MVVVIIELSYLDVKFVEYVFIDIWMGWGVRDIFGCCGLLVEVG